MEMKMAEFLSDEYMCKPHDVSIVIIEDCKAFVHAWPNDPGGATYEKLCR